MERAEMKAALWQAMDELPENTRQALLLHYISGMTDSEIADFTGVSASAIRSRLQYGRERLRDLLLPVMEDEIRSRAVGTRFSKKVMAALPLIYFSVPDVDAQESFTLFGLNIKEVAVALAGIVAIGGLVGMIAMQAGDMENPDADSGLGRLPLRLASAEQMSMLKQQLREGDADEAYLDETPDHAPLARLMYRRQTGPHAPFTITGVPGCVAPGSEIYCDFPDGTRQHVATAADDGSFAFVVPSEKAKPAISVRAEDSEGRLSGPTNPRLEYLLLMEGMRPAAERGWFNITTAAIGREGNLEAWEQFSKAHRRVSLMQDNWLGEIGWTKEKYYSEKIADGQTPERPDSVRAAWDGLPKRPEEAVWEISAPEDLLIYGNVPGGRVATFVMRATGASVAGPVQANGDFSLTIPADM
jgi:hypothetical protein